MSRARARAARRLAALVLLAAPGAAAAPALAQPQPPPSVSAPSAIVVETSTGAVPFERDADSARPIASVTKLMTALVTLEQERLAGSLAAVPYDPGPTESQVGLRPGERLSRADMLRALLLASANDAAAALAEDVGGSRKAFVRAMNARAARLELGRTRFADPIGLDPGSRSSARDLVGLVLELRRFPFFRSTVDRATANLRTGDEPRALTNRNTLVREYPWVTGVKTGHTARAGYVLVASARRRGVSLVSVVLGTRSEAARNADTLAILRHGFAALSRRTAVKRGEVLGRVPIRHRRGAELSVAAARTVRRVVPRGVRPRARVLELPAHVEGPVRRGQRVGRAEILVGADRVGTVSLVASAEVPAAGVTQRAKDRVTAPGGFLAATAVLVALVGGLLRLRGLRGRGRRRRPPRPRAEAGRA